MIDVIVVLVILLILIAAYRLTAPRTDAGCGACKGSCKKHGSDFPSLCAYVIMKSGRMRWL